MGTVVPVSKDNVHAIQRVTFAVELSAPIREDALASIIAAHSQFEADLPRVQELSEVKLTFGPDRASQSTGAARRNGVIFDRLSPKGETEWALAVAENSISVNCHIYTRWNEVWAQAYKYFSIVVPTLSGFHDVSAFGLQYFDQFLWSAGDTAEIIGDDVFARHSDYLPEWIFNTQGVWHIHQGFFTEDDQPAKHKTLNNFNIDIVGGKNDDATIKMMTLHRSLLASPLEPTSALQVMEGFEHQMHDFNKSLLCSLLKEELKQKISLDC